MALPITLVNDAGVAFSAVNAFPYGGASVVASSGNAANAAATATMAAVPAKTNYITGFDVTGAGATAGLAVVVTVAGLIGGAITFTYTASVGALVANTPLMVRFPTPIAASAINTAITISCPALGLGATNNIVNAYGFVL
jgi:hypothetical protein